jgi:protein SCO1/2
MTSMRARWLLVAAAVCAAFAGFWLAHQIDRPGPRLASGTWLPAPRPFTLERLAGAPTLVFFGFTHCPDVCPTTLLKLAQLEKRAPVKGLRVLFISIDPQRDTPPLLGMYVHAFAPEFQGLTGEPQAIANVARDFGVAVNRVELPGGDYTMDHSAVVFLLDDAGRIAAIFTPPFEVAALSADLERAAPYLKSRAARATT